jgi:hypothetical protein
LSVWNHIFLGVWAVGSGVFPGLGDHKSGFLGSWRAIHDVFISFSILGELRDQT